MASKKFAFIFGLISLFFSAAQAQNDAGYDWRDSSKIPTKRLPQQSEFANNSYPYPAKPRSKWELGLSAGYAQIIGDIAPKASFGGSVSLRKAISHTFSFRGGYTGMMTKGEPNSFRRTRGVPAGQVNQRNFRAYTHSGNFDLIASLLPNNRYRGNPKFDLYILGGVDVIAHKVYFENKNGKKDFGGVKYSTFYGQPDGPGVQRATQQGTWGTFGGKAPFENGGIAPDGSFYKSNRKGWTLLGGASVGGGLAYKVSKNVNVGFEQRFTFTQYDYLDAYKFPGSNNDILSYTSARLNLAIGNSAKRVDPLYWINPNNYVYNELNKPTHFKIPAPVMPDADGDGITDQFDMEPNTPAGAPVDVRGVARDTDGDGVPDYKDKELLTPQKCFPVDADGMGNCPEPACCKEIKELIQNGGLGNGGNGGNNGGTGGNCNIGNLPTIQFKTGSAVLSKESQNLLRTAAAQIKAVANCRVKVTGHGTSNKSSQQLSWDRVNSVIRYLVEKQGISEERFIFTYGEDGDANTVDLMGTTDSGPNRVPAPHPNLKSK